MYPKFLSVIQLTVLLLVSATAMSQVAVNTDGSTPDNSAILDVKSTLKGMLLPRMTQAERDAITNPATGLVIYQTNNAPGFYYFDGSDWTSVEGWADGGGGHVIDSDGNVYATVIIGNQEWMAQNLSVTHYRNGDSIPNVTDNTAWAALTSGGWAWYGNNQTTNGKYGILYNWHAVSDSRNLCPTGWHVASSSEWSALITYLGGSTLAGGPLKAAGQWNTPNTGAKNTSGFSALPGGFRSGGGSFLELGATGHFWTSTQETTTVALGWKIYYNNTNTNSNQYTKICGLPVRCVRD